MINNINIFNLETNKVPQKKEIAPQKSNLTVLKSGQVSHYNSIPRMSMNYFVPFLGKKDYTENEKEFFNLKRQISRTEHQLNRVGNEKCWNQYMGDLNAPQKYEIKTRLPFLYMNSEEKLEFLKEIKKAGVTDPILAKSLDNYIKAYSTQSSDAKKAAAVCNILGNDIAKKVNAYRGEVRGKTYSNIELDNMLKNEKNAELRKEIYSARKVNGSDLVAEDLVELVKERNKFAKTKGYDNYFSYQLAEVYHVDEKKLFNLLDDLEKKTDKIFDKMSKKESKELAEAYGIKPKDLRPWHYGLELEGSVSKEADKYVTDNEKMMGSSFDLYKRMGWDIPKLPILLDLFPKENKNQHGFCFDIDTNKDVRILANLSNDLYSHETLNHELGHAVYDIGISEHLPYNQRGTASSAMTEAVAMLMETLDIREGSASESLGMPEELVKKLDIERRKNLVPFVRKYSMMINFERELYKNPDQNIGKLWYELEHKHMNKNMPEEPDNAWASIPHFLSHPAYIHNYLRAEIMASQIYDAAKEKLGPLTQNENTAEYFRKKLFRVGASVDENELIKKVTGKELSVDAFCNQFKDLKID